MLAPVLNLNSFKVLIKRVDHLLTLLSCFVIPALVGGFLVMALERAPDQHFISGASMIGTSGGTIQLNLPLIVHTDTRKALYRIFITDSMDSIVYVYPEHRIRDPQQFSLSKQDLQLPTLKPGQYQIHAHLVYWFNPFKNGTVDFEATTLIIR